MREGVKNFVSIVCILFFMYSSVCRSMEQKSAEAHADLYEFKLFPSILMPDEEAQCLHAYEKIMAYAVWHDEDLLSPPGAYRVHCFGNGLRKYRENSIGSDYTVILVYKNLPPYAVRFHRNVITEEVEIFDSFLSVFGEYDCYRSHSSSIDLSESIKKVNALSASSFEKFSVTYSSDTLSSQLLTGMSTLDVPGDLSARRSLRRISSCSSGLYGSSPGTPELLRMSGSPGLIVTPDYYDNSGFMCFSHAAESKRSALKTATAIIVLHVLKISGYL